MKKFIVVAAIAAVAVLAPTVASRAYADTGDTATSTAPMSLGGWATPCFYLRQTHENDAAYICNDADYSMQRFAFDSNFRQEILGPWSYHVFVELPARFNR